MRKQSIMLRTTILLGGIALWCAAWVLAQPHPPTSEHQLIAPLLPQGEGQSACYAGTFTGQAMDIEDWSRARAEPTENLAPDGKPYMRPVPPVIRATPIRAFTLQLTYDSRTSDYDWVYNFRGWRREGVRPLSPCGGESGDKFLG